MSESFAQQAKSDFQKARFQAFFNRAWDALSGQRTTLLSYDEIKEKLRIGGPIYRGVKTVRLDQIAGSLNRYHEFDRVFLPACDAITNCWQRVNRAFYIIRDTHILNAFPDKTQGDLYLWVLDHQHYLETEAGIPLQPPEQAARTFLEKKIVKSSHTRKAPKRKEKNKK